MRVSTFNFVQIVLGGSCLLFGASIYVFIRVDPDILYFPAAITLSSVIPAAAIEATNQLPIFFHTLAYSLLTMGILSGGRRMAALVCTFWLVTEITFEFGQHPAISGWLALRIPDWFDNVWILDQTRGFFMQGTFDPLDIIATLIAASLSFIIFLYSQSQYQSKRMANPIIVKQEYGASRK